MIHPVLWYWGIGLRYRSQLKQILAKELLNSITVTPVEHALINAIQAHLPADHPASYFPTADKAHANAMKEVYQHFGDDDLDVVTLYADALMYTALRKMFHVQSGLPIAGSPVHSKSRVRSGLRHPSADKHPGLIHCLDPLSRDVCHTGHSNTAVVLADEKYLAKNGVKNFYSFYPSQSKVALKTLDQMESSLTNDVLRVKIPLLADWLEFFKAVRIHDLPLPHDQDLYCVTTTLTHYGKGIAWAATGIVLEADKERELYHAAAKRVPSTRKDFPNLISDVLKVATAMLDGEVEYRRGNYGCAFKSLCEAIRHVEEAATAYAQDLGLNDALTRCLVRLGRKAEARIIKQQLDVALSVADMQIESSCFCRLSVPGAKEEVPACHRYWNELRCGWF
ncbi:hypothetical protein BDV39DRAFT_195206 [Aspergillus sergii]|uniref:Uncharacterized protein n=1 Tax=Aspergillus sergii TaxID=1034303 RepID=A0A5N6WY54_9EURO|nr:hypothetical protein BDV39DRAFT_195206 [Aspergillus sergii]